MESDHCSDGLVCTVISTNKEVCRIAVGQECDDDTRKCGANLLCQFSGEKLNNSAWGICKIQYG